MTSTRLRAAGPWIGLFCFVVLIAGCDTRIEGPEPSDESETTATPPAAEPSATSAPTTTAPPASSSAPAQNPTPAPTASQQPMPMPLPEPEPEPAPEPEPGPAPIPLPEGTLTIMPLGDSITLGVEGGYRNDLYDLLIADGKTVDYVGTQYDTSTKIADKDHEGHPGFTIANARAEVDGWLGTVASPEIVLVMLGTNDEAWWTTKQPSETKDELIGLTDHLLEKLPDAALVIATIPPQSSANVEPINRDRADMTAEYNDLLRSAIPEHTAYGTRLFLADVGAVLQVGDLYDGIHPDREAHKKIADVFHEAIAPLL